MLDPTPEETWVRFPVRYAEGTEPLPPDVIEAARRAVHRRSRPGKDGSRQRALCLVPIRKCRCARCGCRVAEYSIVPRPSRNASLLWQVRCGCVKDLQVRRKMSWAEAAALPECQHRLYVSRSLSLPLQRLLIERLFSGSLDLAEFASPSSDREGRRREVEARERQARARLRTLTGNLTSLDLTLPDVAAEVNRLLAECQQEVSDCDRELALLTADGLKGERQAALVQQLQQVWGQAREEFAVPIDEGGPEVVTFWKNIVDLFVDQVTIDLEAETFRVDVNLRSQALRRLEGSLAAPAENRTRSLPRSNRTSGAD